MSSENRSIASAEGVGEKLLASAKDRLEAERAALNTEIRSYPGPIPACDAQFNHLLEKRAGLTKVLSRFEQWLARLPADGTDRPEAAALIAEIRRTDPEMANKLIDIFGIDPTR